MHDIRQAVSVVTCVAVAQKKYLLGALPREVEPVQQLAVRGFKFNFFYFCFELFLNELKRLRYVIRSLVWKEEQNASELKQADRRKQEEENGQFHCFYSGAPFK